MTPAAPSKESQLRSVELGAVVKGVVRITVLDRVHLASLTCRRATFENTLGARSLLREPVSSALRRAWDPARRSRAEASVAAAARYAEHRRERVVAIDRYGDRDRNRETKMCATHSLLRHMTYDICRMTCGMTHMMYDL